MKADLIVERVVAYKLNNFATFECYNVHVSLSIIRVYTILCISIFVVRYFDYWSFRYSL